MRAKFILSALALAAGITAQADYLFTTQFNSGRIPAIMSTAVAADAPTAVATDYRSGVDANKPGWNVAQVSNAYSYSAVCATHTLSESPVDATLSTPEFTVSGTRPMVRWTARSVYPSLLEAYEVSLTVDGSDKVIYSTKAAPFDWTNYSIDISQYIGKTVKLNFRCTSVNKYMLAVDDIYVGDPEDTNIICVNETPLLHYVGNSQSTAPVKGSLANHGKTMTGVTAVLKYNGRELTLPVGELKSGEEFDYEFNLPVALNETSEYTIGFKDASNAYTELAAGKIVCSYYPRTVLFEEFTGMWCNTCPKGLLKVEEYEKLMGKNLAVLGVHMSSGSNDFLQLNPYYQANKLYSVPRLIVNRNYSTNVDPMDYADEHLTDPTYAKIDIVDYKINEADDNIHVKARVEMAENADNSAGRYRVGYVLTRDIHAARDITNIFQSNALTGVKYERYGILPSRIASDLTELYNVVITSDNAHHGFEASLPEQITAGTPMYFEFDIPRPRMSAAATDPSVTDYNLADCRLVAYVLDYNDDPSTKTVVEASVMNTTVQMLNEPCAKSEGTEPGGNDPVVPSDPTIGSSHTVLLDENFDNIYNKQYLVLELDHQAPATNINSLFQDANGVSQPWWNARDFQTSTNRYAISHSYYQGNGGTSNDWMYFPAITVPTPGFNLTFGAQSLPVREGDEHALSTLRVYISEQAPSKDWQPSEPALIVENLSYGNDRKICNNDWIPFTINLDEYVGKTIYISFANLNTDKDLLCVDDVLVQRLDAAELFASAPEYVEAGEFTVNATIRGTADPGLKNWKLTFKCGDTTTEQSGATLGQGETKDFTFTATVGSNVKAEYTLTLSSDNNEDITVSSAVTGMLFWPTKRIMIEETTGTWCGNCPNALYTLELIETDPRYEGLVLPVSLHVGNDPMRNESYEEMFGLGQVAPMMRVDRADQLIVVTPADVAPDLENETLAAYTILQHLNKVALADIEVSGEILMNAGAVSGVDATAVLKPAVDIDGSKYDIGFIVTENNVTCPNPQRYGSVWTQHNYLHGDALATSANNPWATLPSEFSGMHYNNVARAIGDYYGVANLLPQRIIKAGEEVTVNHQVGLPKIGGQYGAYNANNLYLTAFLIEKKVSEDIVTTINNSNRVALGENPDPFVSSAEMLADYIAGIDNITEGFDGEAEYFNLQGIRVVEPAAGIYIVRRGAKVTKEIVR
ncbi:MAG: choice-of-anchor J domain-containing protein [Muribaculaceae bacterium]|nr:choice-of-anchor J domain-containing protein [Muribaculaceae bacterium]